MNHIGMSLLTLFGPHRFVECPLRAATTGHSLRVDFDRFGDRGEYAVSPLLAFWEAV
jgi:hypothetical protein